MSVAGRACLEEADSGDVAAKVHDLNEAVAAVAASLAEVHKRAAAVSGAAHRVPTRVKRQRIEGPSNHVIVDRPAGVATLSSFVDKLNSNPVVVDGQNNVLYDVSASVSAMFRLNIIDSGAVAHEPRLLQEFRQGLATLLNQKDACHDPLHCKALADIVYVLGLLGEGAAPAVQQFTAVIGLWTNPWSKVPAPASKARLAAIQALGRVGQYAVPAIGSLVTVLGSKYDPAERSEFEAALTVIRGLGAQGRRAVPLLAEALMENGRREGAARALLQLGQIPEAAAIVPRLMLELDRHGIFKCTGLLLIELLGRIGKAAAPAHSLLERLSVLKGEPAAREAASRALQVVGKFVQHVPAK